MERRQHPPIGEKLYGDNYKTWRISMQTYLTTEGLWGVVSGADLCGQSVELKQVWMKINAKALYAIKMSCTEAIYSLIKDISNAKEGWDKLLTTFRPGEVQTESSEIDGPLVERTDPLILVQKIRSGDRDYLETMNIIGIYPIIPENDYTALHVAVSAGQTEVVNYLLQRVLEEAESLSYDDINVVDKKNRTPLALAAYHGKLEIVKILVEKYPRWLLLKDCRGNIPLVAACEGGHVDTTRFLCEKTLEYLRQQRQREEEFEGGTEYWLILGCLKSKMFDIALGVLNEDPRQMFLQFASAPLLTLADTPSAFFRPNPSGFWSNWIFKDMNRTAPSQMCKSKYNHECALVILRIMCDQISRLNNNDLERSGAGRAMFAAVKNGNLEFVAEIIKTNPDMMWKVDESKRDLLMCAIANRQEKIASFVHGMEEWRDAVVSFDDDSNNLLHMVGKIPPDSQLSRISGAALQMQRELQWFKEVESIVPDYFKESKNELNQTPADVFTKGHANLLKDAEKWMKETATSYSIVSALIITLLFAAAFTVPGGNDQNAGVPIYRHKVLFKIFTILVATSFSAASTSVMVFLGILTSRYSEQDFLVSLPRKLMVGLFSLFISMTVMMFAFFIAIIIMFKGKSWTIVLTVLLIIIISIPIYTFGRQHLPLLKEIYVSTYHWHVFKKKRSPDSGPSLSTGNVRARSSNESPVESALAIELPPRTASASEPPAEIASTSELPAEIAVEIST